MALNSSQEELNQLLLSNPTFGNAFRAWLAHAETTLSPREFQSAKNFSRAFRIWYDKYWGKDCQEDFEGAGLDISSIPFICCTKFAPDMQLINCDPVEERLDPKTKTTYIAKNCRLMANFLIRLGLIGGSDISRAARYCAVLEEQNRCRRALWLLYKYEIYFLRQLGGRERPYALSSEELDGDFRVTHVGTQCVIVRACPTLGRKKSQSGPLKVQIPPVLAALLKAGDDMSASLRKAAGADFWVIKSASSVDSYKEHTLLEDSVSPPEPGDAAYIKAAKALLKAPLPSDGFPDEVYSEAWFQPREMDFTSDDEIALPWDSSDE
ncbi:hypothetical protein LshimejAT787_0604250 [Lyophyllum shimeji]|uniref:Uncharacterized protein n=1 Tax=Lyophyllum shimeji TaxID=47721 RepID=A0A9P3UN36_LYOSH|nr:hypothetical protein LshimejAT787_0604250 [Lyophyllum shimeji]